MKILSVSTKGSARSIWLDRVCIYIRAEKEYEKDDGDTEHRCAQIKEKKKKQNYCTRQRERNPQVEIRLFAVCGVMCVRMNELKSAR